MSTARKLKIARTQAGIRQIDLSLRTGIPCSTLSLFENALREPNPDQARLINEALNERVYDLREEEQDS